MTLPPTQSASVLDLLKRVLVLADLTLLRRRISVGNVSTVLASVFSHKISPPLFRYSLNIVYISAYKTTGLHKINTEIL